MFIPMTLYRFPAISFYFLYSPILLYYLIKWKICHDDIKTCKLRLSILNILRTEANNYTENDRQDRKTFLLKFRIKQRYVEVRCLFRRKTKDNEYISYRNVISDRSGCKVSMAVFKGGWNTFKVYTSFEPIAIHDVKGYSVTFGTGDEGLLYWNYVLYPHCLLVGETGQGKSVLTKYILSGLCKGGYSIYCVDGKGIDYSKYKGAFAKYISYDKDNPTEMLQLIEEFESMMRQRYDEMRMKGIEKFVEDPFYDPCFLLIDEQLDILKSLNKSNKESLDKLISNIILLGRAAGFNLISTMQRADAKYLPADVRDNYMLRIATGSASDDSYRMMFGSEKMRGLDIGKAWYKYGTELGVMTIPFYKGIEDMQTKKGVSDYDKQNQKDLSK